MKKIALLMFPFTILFCGSKSKNNNSVIKENTPPDQSILDSLQGTWFNTSDTENVIHIIGRDWYEKYDNNSSYQLLSKIYFSDTAINFDDNNIHQFDTTATTGEYFVFKNLSDTTYECNHINGFNISNGDTTFAFRPIGFWKISSISVFKKTQ